MQWRTQTFLMMIKNCESSRLSAYRSMRTQPSMPKYHAYMRQICTSFCLKKIELFKFSLIILDLKQQKKIFVLLWETAYIRSRIIQNFTLVYIKTFYIGWHNIKFSITNCQIIFFYVAPLVQSTYCFFFLFVNFNQSYCNNLFFLMISGNFAIRLNVTKFK